MLRPVGKASSCSMSFRDWSGAQSRDLRQAQQLEGAKIPVLRERQQIDRALRRRDRLGVMTQADLDPAQLLQQG